MKLISEYMVKNPISIYMDSSIAEAVSLMRSKKTGSVLVNDKEKKTVGIFTERDILTKIDFSQPTQLRDLTVKDVMTTKLITVSPNEKYSDVLALMKKKNIRHLPVVENGHMVGMVSLRDMMGLYEENLEHLLEQKEKQLIENLVEIRGSEERLRTIFNNSAVAIAFADSKENIIAWNPLMSNLLKMDDDDLRNKPVKELYPIQEWKKLRSLNLREHGENIHVETKIIDKNGGPIEVDLSLSVLKNPDGKIIGSIGVVSDIRKRKQVEEQLRKSLRELEDVKLGLDEHAIVAVTDSDGKITYVNDKFCEISEYSPEELLGQDQRIVNSKYHSKEFFKDLWKIIQSGQVWHGEIRNKTKSGKFYWVDTTIVPFLNENAEPYQYVAIRTDITKQREYQEQLEISNRDMASNAKMLHEMVIDRENTNKKLRDTQQQIIQIEKMATLGTLAAGFAHEIKNPLAIILQGMERIERILTQGGDSSNIQYVNMVKSAATRANRVVTSLLRYSRASLVEVQPVNIYEVIDAAVELVRGNARTSDITIQRNFDKQDHFLKGDHIMLQQVFFDLLTNAFDAISDGGEIVIDVKYFSPKKKESGHFVIKVRDTGRGIDEKHLPKIFDPFFTTKDEGKGTGLGLSTVYLILERHGGKIKVDSKPGMGTTFIITLPEEGITENERGEDG